MEKSSTLFDHANFLERLCRAYTLLEVKVLGRATHWDVTVMNSPDEIGIRRTVETRVAGTPHLFRSDYVWVAPVQFEEGRVEESGFSDPL
jgi:hypothetical protein